MLNGNLPSSGSENGAYSTPVLAWCPRFAPWFWALTLAKEDLYDPNLLKPIMAVAAPLPILEVWNQPTFQWPELTPALGWGI